MPSEDKEEPVENAARVGGSLSPNESGSHSQEHDSISAATRSMSDAEASESSEQTRFLIGLEYDNRAERRRVEYRLENWDGSVSKLPRMSRIVEDKKFYDLYHELRETVDEPEHLSVYELNDLAPSTVERTVQIDRVFDVDLDQLNWAVDSLLNKRTVSQQNETTYEIYPDANDESVTFEYHVMDVQQGARMQITLTGPSPTPNALKDAMLRDLGYLLPEPEEVFE